MKGEFTIVSALAMVVLMTPSTSAEESLNPFFVPRPEFYWDRGIASPLEGQTDKTEPTSPNLLRQVFIDFKDVFTRGENLVIVGVGLGAAGAASFLDDAIAESGLNEEVNGGGAVDAIFEAGTVLGSAPVQFGAAFATYGVGKLASKPGVEAVGRDLVRAQIVTQVLTFALKNAVGRERPDGSNNRAFPSGHASATFATATVLQRHYGWDIGIPAYIVGSYVAISRLNEARHYLSDVVFGAAIGILVGRTVTVEIANKRLQVSPMFVPAGAGIQLTWRGWDSF
jgi:membrane-associated phospholipid phosphatase